MKQRAEYEAEVVEGLDSMAQGEIDGLCVGRAHVHDMNKNAILFTYDGDPKALRVLKLAQAVYSIERYEVPRPRALLGDAHFRRLTAQIDAVIGAHPSETFKSFHIAAAGSDSSVMGRIKEALALRLHIPHSDDGGDLLLRIIPDKIGGWRTLVRLTPRPLVTRAWRVQDVPGALNATVAHAMVILTAPKPKANFVNLGSGSGSLLIERCAAAPVRAVIGVDYDPAVLNAARANIAASGYGAHIMFCLLYTSPSPRD